MTEPPIPADEAERLAALQELRILDTPAEERFDRITRTASELFQVPVALISLVDAQRQWFKSRIGLEADETSRAISFCGHAILGHEALVVENALADPRFADNPLVTGQPDIRFYTGMPLRSITGMRLGTLCLIDRVPRHFGTAEVARLRDISAWAERELNLSVEIEASVAEMRATFVRLVSHELRTPVTSIVGALDLVRSGIAAGENIDLLTRIASDGAGQINRIVDDIVTIAELDAGQQPLAPTPIDLPLFVQAAMESHGTPARQARVNLHLQAPQELIVRTTQKLLARILRSLLDNAVRFSPPETTITVRVEKIAADMARISIADQGGGIPAEHMPRLFQPFAQVDAADNRPHNGSGVSLSICRKLAISMGGRLGYEPAENGGSRFFLELPM